MAVRDAWLSERIEAVWHDPDKGREVAGARKMWHLLTRDGICVARCTVERLMRKLGLRGILRTGQRVRTTRPDLSAPRPVDLVKRDFHASHPNGLWVVDFTYVATWRSMAYVAFVQDVYSRRLIGWRVASRMPVELPLDALEMALWVRGTEGHDPSGVVHHSDAGSQYTALRYTDRLDQAGAVRSIGTVGDSYDNAMAESVNGVYKAECVKLHGPFHTVEQLELATCEWVHYYNHHRLHSSIGYHTPIEAEQAYYQPSHDHQAAS
jgi:putative transposase